jgi:acyl-CoA thioesterase FadM
MYRLRFLRTILLCFLGRSRPLLSDFDLYFFAIPLIDTDLSRLFTHAYSSYMGLARWHFVFGSEFRAVALKKFWSPVTTAETINYKRSIKAFSRVNVRTKLLWWNENRFYLEHTFYVKGQVRAHCYLEGLIRSPQGILKPNEVFGALGLRQEPPGISVDLQKWIALRANL